MKRQGALFLVFEGGEGSGKSTVIRWLQDKLLQSGHQVVVTREPGGTPLAEKLRDVLVRSTDDQEEWTPDAEFLVFAASRSQHIKQVIEPALRSGLWVLCDRFADSSVVYQGAVRGASKKLIRDVHRHLMGGLRPDMTFIFDLRPEVGLQRAGARQHAQSNGEDKFELKGLDFHKKIRKAYLGLLRLRDVKRYKINAEKPLEDVCSDVWTVVSKVKGKKRGV